MTPKECVLKDLVNEEFNEEQLFEQYKLYVEMADHVSERRDKTNRFYLSIITGIISLVSIVFSLTGEHESFIILILICCIVISWNWYQNILSYKRLNSGKFDVINHIEKKLSAKGFTVEWILVKDQGYHDLTNIEKNIPLFFMGICILILLIIIVQNHLKFF